jgi:YD repeat-containing protein
MLATVLAALPATVHTASATYHYDTKGRVSKIIYDNGTVVDYTYDLNGNRIGATNTTPPPDTTPPSAPGTPSFSNVTATSATASWTAATDDSSVVGYDYKLNTGNWQALTNVLSVNLTGLTTVTNYTFQVRARDAATNLGPASSNTFTTPDNQAPTVPTGLSGSAPNSSTVNLTWNAATDNVAVTGYRVYRNGGQIGTSATTSFSDGGRTGTTTYAYQVAAYDAVPNVSGLSSAINVTTPDTIAPSIPASLSAVAAGTSKINLSWGASGDTGGSGLAGYKVYRNGSPTPIATPGTNSFQDTGLASSTAYTYTVAAYDNATNTSGMSNTAGATTSPPLVASINATSWTWKLRGSNQTIDPPRVCSATGGSGMGYTYQWLWVSGDTQTSVNSPNSSSTEWSRSMLSPGTYSSIWRCLVTDSLGNTGDKNITVNFIRSLN